jgi:hypothetical protein
MKFKDGITLTIERLFQKRSYYALIKGVPNTEVNQEMVQNIKFEASRLSGVKATHVIVPIEKKMIVADKEVMSSLPNITCMAELSYYKPIHDMSFECSRLCLVWYQEEYVFPIDKNILMLSIN